LAHQNAFLAAQFVTLQIKNWMKKSQNKSGLVQQNGFGPAFLHPFLRLVHNRRFAAKPNTCN
jgi:hypothetical protein